MKRNAARKAASIKDVAALANVSVSTVSRYLNKRETVSEVKRTRITSAIRLLGYRPNAIARALVKDRTRFIAILSTNTTLYGQSQTIKGIEMSARSEGYFIAISVLTDGDIHEVEKSVQYCLDQNPAGIILLNFDSISHQAFRFIPNGLPVVLIAGDYEQGTTQITLKEKESGYELTKYLLTLGHKFVVHVAIPGGAGGYSRLSGWREASEEAGAPTPPPINADWNPESGRQIGRTIGENAAITAVFAGNDELAMGVIRGLNDVGRQVPEDVSVVGFDDHPISGVWNPSITTIRQNFADIGRKSFELLKEELDDSISGDIHIDKWRQFISMPGELIIRKSTAKFEEF